MEKQTNNQKLTSALQKFQKQYPQSTSGDLQTFILGWQEAMKSFNIIHDEPQKTKRDTV